MAERQPVQPKDRDGFQIGIICALSLEAEMVELILDKIWKKKEDGNSYGRALNDPNTYTTGFIAGHNVVLAYCPGMGSNSAADVARSLTLSFTGVKIAFVVGICGAVPSYSLRDRLQEIMLGDCLICTGVIQFDHGRAGAEGFVRKDGLDGLGRASTQIRGLMAKLQTLTNKKDLVESLSAHLQALQKVVPGTTECPDRGQDYLDGDEQQPEHCTRLAHVSGPRIHFGYFGSSNSVLKSNVRRDELAKTDKIIAFEMEAAGVWDVCPTIVIKAASDYADSHKNKRWQEYAAAVAAAGLKAFLQVFEFSDAPPPQG